MPLTLRLSPDLHNRAMIHAHRTGISLNKLVAVALDDYLLLREDSPPYCQCGSGLRFRDCCLSKVEAERSRA